MSKEISNQTERIKKKSEMTRFLFLVAGQFISSIGSGLTDFGLGIYVLKMTGSVTATAMISICAFLPTILLTPLGGVLADHYDRRLMMMLGEFLSGVGLVIALIPIINGSFSFSVICMGVAISSVFGALMEPAFKATITDLLTEEDYAKAGGLVQIANNAKLLISPALAGLLLQVTTVGTLIIIDILTFFTTALSILAVKRNMEGKKREPEKLHVLKELQEGLHAIKGKTGIIALICIMTLTVFCLGFIQILSKPLILAVAGEKELGYITTISACGMMAGSIIVSCFKTEGFYTKLLSFGLIGCGIMFALMGWRDNMLFIGIFGFLMFVCLPAVQIGAEVLIRKNLKNEVQGRAFGIIGLITQLGYIVAYALSGVLSDYVFEPFMTGNSSLSNTVGEIIGKGTGRGVALLIIIAGVMTIITGMVTGQMKCVKKLEDGHETVMEACE